MAIAKVQYKENASATPEVWMDTTQKTVTAGTMLSGTTALKNDGTGITGNIASKSSSDLTASGATVTAPAGYYPNAASKSVATTTHPNPTASINATTGVVTASHTQTAGYVAAGTTTGTLSLTTQAAKTVAPTESEQTAVSAGVYTTGAVKVGAISSTYVGSDVAQNDSSDLTASGATVMAPAGFYAESASKTVASGSASTPATSITANPTISVNASGLITASVSGSKSVTPTVSAGFVSAGTAGTVSVSGSNTQQLSTQAAATITPSTTSQTAVAAGKYTTGAVTVAAMPSGTAGTPTATKGTVSNHSVSITPSVTNTTGYITGGTKNGTAVTVDVTELESGTKSITANGTGISVSGYSAVDVDVPSQVPTGVKYVYSDVDGIGAWDVSGFEKCSVDGAPLNDGHLRLWFYFPSDAIPYSTSFVFGFNRTAGSISIDWGDGSSPTEKTSSSFTATISHTYTSAGLFVVDVTFISGNVQLYNTQGTWASYLVAFEAHALNPQVINNSMFPNISDFSVLKSAWFGDELTTVGLLKTCISLERIRLSPNTVNIIAEHFAGDSSLKTFVVPSSVSSIAKNAFKDCVSLEEIHLLPTTPPTLAANKQSSDSAFYNTPSDMVIYVPSGCLTAYQSATNWSTFASQMQEELS